jgi:hypothetical protein
MVFYSSIVIKVGNIFKFYLGTIMKKRVMMLGLLAFVVTGNVFAVPIITKSTSSGTTFKFIETLNEKLPSGYKVKIDLNNGKGLVAMTCSGAVCTLSTSVPANFDLGTYSVAIYNTKGVIQGEKFYGTYLIKSEALSQYTKISNSGLTLPDTAVLGSGENDWACTKDNKTGLIWEVKTTDGGIRDRQKTYTNYFVGEKGYSDNTNSDAFVKAVNTKNLCGANNWRLPKRNELQELVVCSDSKYRTIDPSEFDFICQNYNLINQPTINTNYFPNTQRFEYWTLSPLPTFNGSAVYIGFDNSLLSVNFKSSYYYIRLVHD